jgi:hypothetical protein
MNDPLRAWLLDLGVLTSLQWLLSGGEAANLCPQDQPTPDLAWEFLRGKVTAWA